MKISDILSDYKELESFWQPRNTAIANARKLFFLDHYGAGGSSSGGVMDTPNAAGTAVSIGTTVNYKRIGPNSTLDANGAYRVTSSEYTDYILALRSMLSAQAPIIRVYSDRDTKVSDERATNAEKLLHATRYVNRIRQESDFVDNLVDSTLTTGWGVLYGYWDELFAKDYDRETASWQDFPLVLKSLPPEFCFMETGGRRGRWRKVIYAWERPIEEIEDEWEVKLKKTKRDDKDKDLCMYYDCWWWEGDKVWQAVAAGDDWCKKPTDMSKWYSSLPFTIVCGLTTASTAPDEMALSMLYSMKPNVELQEDLTTRLMTIITNHADPILVANDGDGTPIEVNKMAGGITHLRTGQSLAELPGGGASQDVYQMLQWVQGAVQRSGLPAITYGQGLSGLSGYAISLMGQGGQMKTVVPIMNLETGLSIAMDKILDIFRKFSPDKKLNAYGQDTTGKVFSISMTGNELRGLRVDVKMKPKIPQDEVARANIARLLSGLVSQFYVKDHILEMQDPVGDTKRQLIERFTQHPVIMAQEMAAEAKEWGYTDTDVQMFLQATQPSQTAQPTQGPPRPGNAGAPMPTPGQQTAPPTPDEIAQAQMMAAAQGRIPGPEGM